MPREVLIKVRKHFLLIAIVIASICALMVTGCEKSKAEQTKSDESAETISQHKTSTAPHERPERLRLTKVNLRRAFAYYQNPDQKGEITYTIEEPGLVNIVVLRAGTRELYLAKIVHWEYRDAGTHTETWDGRDNSGNIINPKEASIRMSGEKMSSYAPGTMPLKDMPDEEIVHGHEWGHAHATHHEFAEETPILTITSIKDGDVLKGKVLIKAEVDKEKRGYGDKYGYGVRYYLGKALVSEEFYKPESDGKFVYELDTTAFEDGEHILYMGMCDHNQHATSAGVTVTIDNSNM